MIRYKSNYIINSFIVLVSIISSVMGVSHIALAFTLATSIFVSLPWLIPLFLPLVSLFYFPIIKLGALNITLTDILIAFSILNVILYYSRSNSKVNSNVIVLLVLSFLPMVFGFIGSLSTFGSFSEALSSSMLFAKRFAMYSFIPLTFVFINRNRIRNVTYILLICAVISSITAIFPQINATILSPELKQNYGERRVGLLLNPNVAGNYAVMFLNFAVALILYGKDILGRYQWLAYTSILFSGGLLLVSGSRGAVFAAFASLLFWLWFHFRNVKLFTVIATSAALLAGSLTLFPDISLFERWARFSTQGTQEVNVASRLDSQALSLKIYLEHPIFGTGIGSLERLAPSYGSNITGADSQYVDTLVETGTLGLLVLLALLYIIYKTGIKYRGVYGTTLAVNTLTLAVSGFSAFTFYSPFLSILLWYLLGMASIESKEDRNEY